MRRLILNRRVKVVSFFTCSYAHESPIPLLLERLLGAKRGGKTAYALFGYHHRGTFLNYFGSPYFYLYIEPFKFQGNDNAMCADADCSKN